MRQRKFPWPAVIAVVLMAALGIYNIFHGPEVESRVQAFLAGLPVGDDRAAAELPARSEPEDEFRCDGRTRCSEMTSCAEAEFFLRHCPHTEMDGDHDGIPCERQWCTGL